MTATIDIRRVLEELMLRSTSLTLEEVVGHYMAKHPPAASADRDAEVQSTTITIQKKLKVCVAANLVHESPVFDVDSGTDKLRYTITPLGCDFIRHR